MAPPPPILGGVEVRPFLLRLRFLLRLPQNWGRGGHPSTRASAPARRRPSVGSCPQEVCARPSGQSSCPPTRPTSGWASRKAAAPRKAPGRASASEFSRQKCRPRASWRARLLAPPEADIAAGFDQTDMGELGADHLHAAVARAVVGDDDLQPRLPLRLPALNRGEAGAQQSLWCYRRRRPPKGQGRPPPPLILGEPERNSEGLP